MSNFNRNQISTLKHLADGQEHADAPNGLTEAQFFVALKSLQVKDMVFATFSSENKVISSRIKISGRAALDDMRSKENRILRGIVADKGLTIDQYDLLQYAKVNGKCENIFDIPFDDYRDLIWRILYQKRLIDSDYDEKDCVYLKLTMLGLQTLDEIEEEVNTKLSNENNEEEQQSGALQGEIEAEESHKIMESGLRISNGRIRDVIKVLWSMNDIGLFENLKGHKPHLIDVMKAFAEFLQAEQLNNYSPHMSGAMNDEKITYLNVFHQLEKSAEKHYDDREGRRITK